MKSSTIITLRILFLFLISQPALSGEIHWLTDSGLNTLEECEFEVLNISDNGTSEYFINCDKHNHHPIILIDNNTKMSRIWINRVELVKCPVNTAIFGTGKSFYLFLDCSELIFLNKFED